MPNERYATDLIDAAWELIASVLPRARTAGRQRTTDIRAVLNAIFYLLHTGCQWRRFPGNFRGGAPSILLPNLEEHARLGLCSTSDLRASANAVWPVAMPFGRHYGRQSVQTTERGGVRGLDGPKRGKGRTRTLTIVR